MIEVKLQTLEYFIQIADEMSYTKAAEKCYISQPAISKAMREFEEELNVALFKREGRKVLLTPTGEEVYQEAKMILRHCERLKMKASTNNELSKPLKIGYIIYGHIEYFQRIIHPQKQLKIETIYDSATNLRKRLENEELDVILVPNSTEKDLEDVQVHYFTLRHMYLLVHESHPLYKEDEAEFGQLKNISIISWDENDLTQVVHTYENEFRFHGVEPQIVGRARKMGDMVTLMHQHHAVGLSGPITTILFSGEYKLIPIVDSRKKYGLCAVWKTSNEHSSLPDLIKAIRHE